MSDTVRSMIRINDILRRLGIARSTLYEWVEAGEFPRPVNIGGMIVAFYEDEIAAWQKEREEQSLAPPHRQQKLKPIRPRAGFRSPMPTKKRSP